MVAGIGGEDGCAEIVIVGFCFMVVSCEQLLECLARRKSLTRAKECGKPQRFHPGKSILPSGD